MSKEKQVTMKFDGDEKVIVYPNGRKVKRILKEHEVDKGERGIYNNRNQLNDLTGKEWTFFINSVHETDFSQNKEEFELWRYLQDSIIKTKYSTNGNETYGHNLRKLHPSPKPPQLMRDIIAFFTKKGGWILDPFMGVGGVLIGASLLEDRHAVGIDLEKKYLDIYEKVCQQENIDKQLAIAVDARNVDKLDELKDKKFDLILTDPPYADMLSKKRTGGDRKDKGSFTRDDRDLGNISYNDFFPEFRVIIEKCCSFLKKKGYLVIFCKDLQPTKKHDYMLHADIVRELVKIESINFKGYKIWYDKTINLYPYGYPFSYVSNQLHQFILIFRKEVA